MNQAKAISSILKTNPILNDDEKSSLNETVGVLTWLNQLQLGWKDKKEPDAAIPEEIRQRIFEGREPQKFEPATVA